MNLESLQAFMKANPLFFAALVVWILVWKGLAMWKAGQRGDKIWFIAIFVLNTLGILDIIYYYFIGKNENTPTDQEIG